MALSRHDLLTRSAGVGIVAVGDLGGLFAARPAFAPAGPGAAAPVPDPAGILDLPPGFSYSVVRRAGDPLSAGGVVPGRPESATAFRAPRGGVRLVQNHEIAAADPLPTVADTALTYDPQAKGVTTTLTLNRRLQRVDDHISLAGTWSNRAGGITPWGTWLTGEATEQRAGAMADKDHGFVFEVDPNEASNNVNPTPLKGLGRFAHDAACIDPLRGDVYLTESASHPNGLAYRFRPFDQQRTYGALRNGGFLQAMRCRLRSTHVPDLGVFSVPGTTLNVDWVPIPDPLATTSSIRKQYTASEVTRSATFAGAWWGAGGLDRAYIACSYARPTDGSPAAHEGQVWAYGPNDQTLTLEACFSVTSDPTSDAPEGPVNVAVSPHGGLVLADSGGGVLHLLAVDDDGETSVFARNRTSSANGASSTRATFSPDGSALFATLPEEGLTLAISGPFRNPLRS